MPSSNHATHSWPPLAPAQLLEASGSDMSQNSEQQPMAPAQPGTPGSFNERESLKMGEVYVKGAR